MRILIQGAGSVGLGLGSSIPGRSQLIDGFGLIAFASLFPMITVMAYAQASEWRAGRERARQAGSDANRVPSKEEQR